MSFFNKPGRFVSGGSSLSNLRVIVKNQVVELLQQIVDSPGDTDIFDQVAEELVSLAISTSKLPENKRAGSSSEGVSERHDDYLKSKERFIAP